MPHLPPVGLFAFILIRIPFCHLVIFRISIPVSFHYSLVSLQSLKHSRAHTRTHTSHNHPYIHITSSKQSIYFIHPAPPHPSFVVFFMPAAAPVRHRHSMYKMSQFHILTPHQSMFREKEPTYTDNPRPIPLFIIICNLYNNRFVPSRPLSMHTHNRHVHVHPQPHKTRAQSS